MAKSKVVRTEVSEAAVESFLFRASKTLRKVLEAAAATGAAVKRQVEEYSTAHGETAFHLQSAIARGKVAVTAVALKLHLKWKDDTCATGTEMIAALLGASKDNDPRISAAREVVRSAARVWAAKSNLKLPASRAGRKGDEQGAVSPKLSIGVKVGDRYISRVIDEGFVSGGADGKPTAVDDAVLNAALAAFTDAQIDKLSQMSRKRAMIAAQERKQSLVAAK